MIVLLFTTSYPYDGAAEQTFLNPEIEHLTSSFDRVIVIPQNRSGRRLSTPPKVEVLEEYALNTRKRGLWRAVLLPRLFYNELAEIGPALLRPLMFARLVSFIARAQFTSQWVRRYIEESPLDPTHCIFYTYWLDRASMGLGLVKSHAPICVVSRAHGNDLYEERHKWAYIPCRKQTLSLLDKVFPDSDKGTRYLSERYPSHKTKFETARLGVPDPEFLTSRSQDGTLRIASCSFLVPIKRIDLLLSGIGEAARLRANQQFEWNHFGTGPLEKSLRDLANETLPSNVRHNFRGYVSQQHLMQFYRNNPVDVFANVSQTEGTSVAVMEAISCGIPVVATAVGGNPEIVTEKNGLLLSPNPSATEIANALFLFLDNPSSAASKRIVSRAVWNERYNSERNFPDFISRLKEIRELSSRHQMN